MKKRNVFNLLGIVISVAAIVVGFIVIASPAKSYSASSVDHVAFGGDFYTEEYAATRAAVSNTAVTANNIRELGGKLALYAGLTFIFGGAFAGVSFAKQFFDEKAVLQAENEKGSDNKETAFAEEIEPNTDADNAIV